MIAKQLESLIGKVANRNEAEMVQRFQNLRNTSLFPKSRGKNAEALTYHQIAAGILSITPAKPGYVIYAKSLLKLQPVGGQAASFFGAETLGDAIEIILKRQEALDAFLEMRVSDSEIYAHGSGGTATIVYKSENDEKMAHFVISTAVSLFNRGAEKNYDLRAAMLQVKTETVFYPKLFQKIAQFIKEENRYKQMMSELNA